ncbi:hypothetical protein H671_1g0714 [Cricetulus griseus]|nr:hypothetical protein H671_1g0714 [Cricetulus griseus]
MPASGAPILRKLVTSTPSSLMDFTCSFSECTLHCVQPALPVITVWFLDILQEDSATSLVLQLHQFLSVFPVLMRLVEKVFDKVLQSHIIPVKEARH